MAIRLESHLGAIQAPANLRINDQIRRCREVCRRNGCLRPYHHFAFGQSPFPPPPTVVAALERHAGEHDYLPTAGLPELRAAVARFYRSSFALDTTADDIIVGPGSKEILAILLAVLEGPVLIPTPSWVSYLPQAQILRKRVVPIRTAAGDGFRLTPERLEAALSGLSSRQKVLILNHPNNPTGATYTRSELAALAETCRDHGVIVVADEIYALTTFGENAFTSMAVVYPEGTIVTGGLSKDRSCGGWRLGVGVFPSDSGDLLSDALKVAGSTYSCVAAPIQHAAVVAYAMDDPVVDHMETCRRINATVGRRAAELFGRLPGVRTTVPGGGFYLFVDFNEYREALIGVGLTTCVGFAENLLEVEHSAILPAESLLLPPEDFSARCSFVDYDGAAALALWRARPPASAQEMDAFVQAASPLVVDGVAAIGRYLEQLGRGVRPRHM